jgi:hypothetical protein
MKERIELSSRKIFHIMNHLKKSLTKGVFVIKITCLIPLYWTVDN